MSNLSLDFTGRVIVVTGAARGIGLEIARTFVGAGGRVVLVDSDAEETARAVELLDASDEAAYVTGVVLPVDGGISM